MRERRLWKRQVMTESEATADMREGVRYKGMVMG